MIETLCENEWVSLKKMVDPEQNVNGYVFSHETRCQGHIVAGLGIRFNDNREQPEFLVRNEITPCWGMQGERSSFTGGCEITENSFDPFGDMKREFSEEAGYCIPDENVFDLGTCRGTKSTDTLYHLYVFLIDEKATKEELKHFDSELEKQTSKNEWISWEELINCNDPLIGMIILRFFNEVER